VARKKKKETLGGTEREHEGKGQVAKVGGQTNNKTQGRGKGGCQVKEKRTCTPGKAKKRLCGKREKVGGRRMVGSRSRASKKAG